jgi:hypothetical protein
LGVRFRCHHCERQLHVKQFQAGRRGRCPSCGGAFRVPLTDSDRSLELTDSTEPAGTPESPSQVAPPEAKSESAGPAPLPEHRSAVNEMAEPTPSHLPRRPPRRLLQRRRIFRMIRIRQISHWQSPIPPAGPGICGLTTALNMDPSTAPSSGIG